MSMKLISTVVAAAVLGAAVATSVPAQAKSWGHRGDGYGQGYGGGYGYQVKNYSYGYGPLRASRLPSQQMRRRRGRGGRSGRDGDRRDRRGGLALIRCMSATQTMASASNPLALVMRSSAIPGTRGSKMSIKTNLTRATAIALSSLWMSGAAFAFCGTVQASGSGATRNEAISVANNKGLQETRRLDSNYGSAVHYSPARVSCQESHVAVFCNISQKFCVDGGQRRPARAKRAARGITAVRAARGGSGNRQLRPDRRAQREQPRLQGLEAPMRQRQQSRLRQI